MLQLKQLLIVWNNTFPYDKLYRQKYNIPFGSEEHRKTNQIDIYLDILEDKLFEKYREEYTENKKLKEDYKKDGLMNKNIADVTEEEFNDIFDQVDLTQFNTKEDE